MRLRTFQLLFLFALTGMLTACASKPPVAIPPTLLPQEDLIAKLRTRSELWQGYQAKVGVRGEGAKKTFSAQAFIVADPPRRLRFEAHKLGQTAGVLVFNESRSALWNPSEQVVYHAASGESLVDHFLGAPIPPETFSRSLIAVMSKDQLDRMQILPEESGLLLHIKDPRSEMAFTWKLAAQSEAVESILVREGPRSYTVTYEPPVDLDPKSVPRKVKFESDQWKLEVKIDQLLPSQNPPDSTFTLTLPEGTRSVDLATMK